METLLPEAYKAGYKGKLLELWSEPGVAGRRSGWTVVADAKERTRTDANENEEAEATNPKADDA